MGREIRRVPSNWEHPKYTEENARYIEHVGTFIPLYDNDYESVAQEWATNFELWQRGEHPDQPSDYCKYFWEWESPPDKESYRERKWSEKEATHFQVYETVTEGTPVTSAFSTKEALIEHLVKHGDFSDQRRGDSGWPREAAENFVESEWAPSLIVTYSPQGSIVKAPRDGQFN